MRNRFLNELVKEGVDCLGESWVGGSQLHVWIPEKPTETRSQPKYGTTAAALLRLGR